MRKFINILYKKGLYIILFSWFGFGAIAMNSPVDSPVDSTKLKQNLSKVVAFQQPQKKFKIFDPEKMVAFGTGWNEAVPTNLIITPDGKAVIFGMPSRVCYVNFGTLIQSEPEVLIAHRCVKHSPMFTVAQNDNMLLIVSAGNYMDYANGVDRVAEYIISRNKLFDHSDNKSHKSIFCKKTSEVFYVKYPIQAIALDSTGGILAIASRNSVYVIELKTGVERQSNFSPRAENILIVDVAMRLGDIKVAVADSNGIVDIKNMSGESSDIEFHDIKHVETGDIIEKIHFLPSCDLLYVTHNGKAKIIEADHLLDNAQGIVNSRIFAHDVLYNFIGVDQASDYATIHWTSNTDLFKKARFRIKIRRENNSAVEEFALNVPDAQERYRYITETGQEKLGIAHVLVAALRGNRVVALLTDGTMQLWTLPSKYKVAYQGDSQENVFFGEKIQDRITRGRSFSSPVPGELFKKKKRKSVGRPTNIFRSSGSLDKLKDKKKDKENFHEVAMQDFHNDKDRGETPENS